MNYDYLQKTHWRNRVWNLVSSRDTGITVHPRDAVVLYLAVESDFDRSAALKRGFSEHNLIAVDRDASVVDTLRSSGKLGVHGDVFDILRAWPEHTPLHAVIIDLMGGLSPDAEQTLTALQFAPHTFDTVFCVNMLRGRDKRSNDLRNSVCECRKAIAANISYEQCGMHTNVNPLHRGCILIDAISASILTSFANAFAAIAEKYNIDFSQVIDAGGAARSELASLLATVRAWQHLRHPTIGNYHSTAGTQVFDWVLWRNPIGMTRRVPVDTCYYTQDMDVVYVDDFIETSDIPIKMKNILNERLGSQLNFFNFAPVHQIQNYQQLVQQIAAVLAHRTRRLAA